MGCKDGTIRVMSKDLVPLAITRTARKEISDVKFSPDGSEMVAVSHDSKIYVYTWRGGKLKAKTKPIKKHTSAVLHFDFSRDGGFIHSTCRSYELLFFDL